MRKHTKVKHKNYSLTTVIQDRVFRFGNHNEDKGNFNVGSVATTKCETVCHA